MPSGAPESVVSHNILSRSFRLSWQPPYSEDRNGIITRYVVLITSRNESRTLYSAQSTLELPAEGLVIVPHTTYFVQVAAATAVGQGPYSEQLAVYTREDGKI